MGCVGCYTVAGTICKTSLTFSWPRNSERATNDDSSEKENPAVTEAQIVSLRQTLYSLTGRAAYNMEMSR